MTMLTDDYDYLMLMQDESIAYMQGLDDEQELEFEVA